jgi:hypothetical protein
MKKKLLFIAGIVLIITGIIVVVIIVKSKDSNESNTPKGIFEPISTESYKNAPPYQPVLVKDYINSSIYSYNTNTKINSKEDFVTYLKSAEDKLEDDHGNHVLTLDNYKKENDTIDWDKVLENIKVEVIKNETFYSLSYQPSMCGDYNISITQNGEMSLAAQCGI